MREVKQIDRDKLLAAACCDKLVPLQHRSVQAQTITGVRVKLQRLDTWYEGTCPKCDTMFQTQVDSREVKPNGRLELVDGTAGREAGDGTDEAALGVSGGIEPDRV